MAMGRGGASQGGEELLHLLDRPLDGLRLEGDGLPVLQGQRLHLRHETGALQNRGRGRVMLFHLEHTSRLGL